MSKPSPRKTRNQRRSNKPDIDLTSSVPVTIGFVNLDSDDDNSFVTVQDPDLSLESENYEMSILVRWNGNCEKFTLRRVINLFFCLNLFGIYFIKFVLNNNLLTASKI